MTCLAITSAADVYNKVISLTEKITGTRAEIDFSDDRPKFLTECGDIKDFNISHSGDKAAIVLGDCPAGVDIEVLQGKKHLSVLRRLTEPERAEISCERDFLANWTAKEAFIKMHGYALSSHLKRLQFYGGKIYLDGVEQVCFIRHIHNENSVVCVCCANVQTQLIILKAE